MSIEISCMYIYMHVQAVDTWPMPEYEVCSLIPRPRTQAKGFRGWIISYIQVKTI